MDPSTSIIDKNALYFLTLWWMICPCNHVMPDSIVSLPDCNHVMPITALLLCFRIFLQRQSILNIAKPYCSSPKLLSHISAVPNDMHQTILLLSQIAQKYWSRAKWYLLYQTILLLCQTDYIAVTPNIFYCVKLYSYFAKLYQQCTGYFAKPFCWNILLYLINHNAKLNIFPIQ